LNKKRIQRFEECGKCDVMSQDEEEDVFRGYLREDLMMYWSKGLRPWRALNRYWFQKLKFRLLFSGE
jgi:hypothetical protein